MRTMLVNLPRKIDLKNFGEKAIYVLTSLFLMGQAEERRQSSQLLLDLLFVIQRREKCFNNLTRYGSETIKRVVNTSHVSYSWNSGECSDSPPTLTVKLRKAALKSR